METELEEMDKYKSTGVNFVSKKTHQFIAATTAATGTFSLGIVVAWTSPCLIQIKESDRFEGGVSEDELSWIASLFPVGALFSGFLAGFLVKKFGGLRTMLILCIPMLTGWLLILFAQYVAMIYVGRFLLGISTVGLPLVLPIYVSKIAEDSIRGIASATMTVPITLGLVFTYAVGYFVSWVTLTLISALFPLTYFLCLLFIPSSPHYYISRGDKVKAGKVLMWLRGANNLDEVKEDLQIIQLQQHELESNKMKRNEVFAPEILKPVFIILIVMVIQQFSGINATFFFTARIFAAANVEDPGLSAIAIGIVNVFVGIAFMFLIERAGRKLLLLVSCLGCAIALAALGTFFFLQDTGKDMENLSWLPLTSMAVFNISFGIGLGSIPFILMAEVLPPQVVEMASALAMTLNASLGFIIAKTFENLVSLLGESGCFWMFGSCCAIGVLFVFFFIPETKGKNLKDIQKHFKSGAQIRSMI